MKALSARERTVSLFTGKTDHEDPNARDGVPAAIDRRPKPRRALQWLDGISSWADKSKRYRIDRVSGEYVAFKDERAIGTYPTIFAATDACEAGR